MKKSKSEVDYGPAKGKDACVYCRFFLHGDSPDDSRCSKVKGVIKAQDWCNLFKRKGLDPRDGNSDYD